MYESNALETNVEEVNTQREAASGDNDSNLSREDDFAVDNKDEADVISCGEKSLRKNANVSELTTMSNHFLKQKEINETRI